MMVNDCFFSSLLTATGCGIGYQGCAGWIDSLEQLKDIFSVAFTKMCTLAHADDEMSGDQSQWPQTQPLDRSPQSIWTLDAFFCFLCFPRASLFLLSAKLNCGSKQHGTEFDQSKYVSFHLINRLRSVLFTAQLFKTPNGCRKLNPDASAPRRNKCV